VSTTLKMSETRSLHRRHDDENVIKFAGNYQLLYSKTTHYE